MGKTQNFLTDNWIWIALAVLALLLVGLVFFVLSTIARGALISCVGKIDAGQPTDFKDGLRTGAKKFWSLLATTLAVGLVLLLAFVILGVPVGLLFYFEMTVRAILLLLFALAIYIPLTFILSLVVIWSWQYIVLQDKKVIESWKAGFALLKNNLGANLVMWLLLFLVSLVAGIAFMVAIIIVVIPFVVLGVIGYMIASWAGVVAIAAAGVVLLFALSLLYSAILATFQSATWTLMFREITGDTK